MFPSQFSKPILESADPQAAVSMHSRLKHILLAEDDPEMRKLLMQRLVAEGYHVVQAKTGLELLQALEPLLTSERIFDNLPDFDLIISDIRMPTLTGIEVIEYFREMDRRLPVILITAFGDEETHQDARRLGVAQVIDKPFDIDDLILAVRKVERELEKKNRRFS